MDEIDQGLGKSSNYKKDEVSAVGEALAKEEMICPFLGQLCKNCAIYIGRHYYLCYWKNDRRSLGRRRGAKKALPHHPLREKTKKDFRIPKIKIDALDPFNADL